MSLSRIEAWEHLCAWTPSEALRRHGRSVEISMRTAATQLGVPEETELWGLAGLLHDADYEAWPEEHPKRIVAWLAERGEKPVAHAISAHYTKWGVPYDTLMDKALVACDELTGFLGACSMIRPEGVATLNVKSVMKKFKDKKFAAGVEREEVQAGCAMIGVEVREWVEFLIPQLQPHAEELGWVGRG
ncbi:MAG: metal-dependent phosphohydrolase [Planctomycetota bacterium]|nr:metal-dependent phosphohydrolase [Planctomycetota bacterium]MDA1112696.1 metal-dependent phosphohydrolase [Planctomycetota bacterium]